MQDRVYLDWNATTPLRREAREAMAAAWDLGGNPSSIHAEGRRARGLVEDARATVAAAVGAEPRNVVFTSGGTEANALALTPGISGQSRQAIEQLIVSSVEHVSVLAGGQFTPERIKRLRVRRSGLVDLEALRTMLAADRPRWCRSCSPTMKPALSSRSRRSPIWSTTPAACCMSMRFRRSEKFIRYQRIKGRSSLGFRAQDRRPKGDRRLDPGCELERPSGVDPGRRSGTGTKGRNRKCRRPLRVSERP